MVIACAECVQGTSAVIITLKESIMIVWVATVVAEQSIYWKTAQRKHLYLMKNKGKSVKRE